MKILLALGSDPHAEAIATSLRANDWHVVVETDRETAGQWLEVGEFDAVILPADAETASSMRALRFANSALAVLAIGPAQVFALKALLFGAGVDDVMSHPIVPAEVVLRAAAVLRRRVGHVGELCFGDLTIVPGHHALVRGKIWRMSNQEWQLLEFLALRAGRVVSKEAMLARLYADRVEYPDSKIIDVRICRLRGSLRAFGLDPSLISTVWGQGYHLPRPFRVGSAPEVVAATERHAPRGRAMAYVSGRAA